MSERSGPGLGHRFALMGEVVASGLRELWAHKLRSLLTLTLLMLGVFALVVMTSLLGGIMDKITSGFRGMGWDGALVLRTRSPETAEEQKRFAQSPGLRMEDLPRLTVPGGRILAFLPRAVQEQDVRVAGGNERVFVTGNVPEYLPVMNRRIASGRGLTEDDQKRRSPVAVLGASLASRLLGGADPVGREIVVGGVPFRVVGVLAPLMIFSDDAYFDANGILVPLEAYMDRLEPSHRLSTVTVKLRSARDLEEVSALMLSRARQAHHGIEDVEVKDLDAEAARSYGQFLASMRGWRIVLLSLAGTVLLVGGVGVLSVMLISCSDRRFEIGLRKALGASDREILGQFLLEAAVLAALGALAGTLAGALVCETLSARFPFGLVVDPLGLAAAWAVAMVLALGFGLYPALRAMRLSPMEAMR
jgi:putative ABC transport system permease protein